MASTSRAPAIENINICDGCSLKSLDVFRLVMSFEKDINELYIFLRRHGVLDFCHLCKKCGKECTINFNKNLFGCYKLNKATKKKPVKCEYTCSIFKKTFFEQTHLPVYKVFNFVYFYFLNPHSRCKVLCDQLNIGSNTFVDWSSFVREVCVEWTIKNSEQIGGQGIIVEIDEAKFGRRKYNRGRIVEGQWVFGGVERENKHHQFLVPVAARNKDTLLALIIRHIRPGSVIYSDCWKAYECLGEEGFTHLTVNHSLNFVDPETGAHTQNIERLWRDVRGVVPKYGRREKHFVGYLAEARFILCNKTIGDKLHNFWITAGVLYPPK